jgi:hypothetical protein
MPYHALDARRTVIFNNTLRLVSGFLPELYERLQHDAILGVVYEVLHFPFQSAPFLSI